MTSNYDIYLIFKPKLSIQTLILLRLWLSQCQVPHFPQSPPRRGRGGGGGHLLGICHLVSFGGGDLSENLCPGVGHLSILLEAVNTIPFSILH